MNIKHLFIIFSLISISYCAKKRIYNLTENEFIELSKETKNKKTKWLMIFYTDKYHDYDKLMDLIKIDIYTKYKSNKNLKFGFIDINKNAKWLKNILNIKSIPFLILISNERMYYYNYNSIDKENIIKFLDEQKNLEESYPIPGEITIFTKWSILYNYFLDILNEYFQGLLDKYDIDYKWNNKLSLLILGLFMIIFFLFEIYFIKLIYGLFLPYEEFEKNQNKNDKIEEIKKEKKE